MTKQDVEAFGSQCSQPLFVKGKELVGRGEIGYLRGLCVSVMGAYLLAGVAAVYAVTGGSVGRQVAAVFDSEVGEAA